MKHLKMLGLAVVVTAVLTAFAGAGTASATTLTGVGGSVLKTGTTIHAVLSGTATLTTSYKNIECTGSTISGSTSNETGITIKAVTTWIFSICNCVVKVIKTSTWSISWNNGSNGTVTSSGSEITTECSTIFGNVHCIYVTNNTDLGTLTGGTTATMDISNADTPRLSTSGLCDESASWDATYKFDAPDTLNVTS